MHKIKTEHLKGTQLLELLDNYNEIAEYCKYCWEKNCPFTIQNIFSDFHLK